MPIDIGDILVHIGDNDDPMIDIAGYILVYNNVHLVLVQLVLVQMVLVHPPPSWAAAIQTDPVTSKSTANNSISLRIISFFIPTSPSVIFSRLFASKQNKE